MKGSVFLGKRKTFMIIVLSLFICFIIAITNSCGCSTEINESKTKTDLSSKTNSDSKNASPKKEYKLKDTISESESSANKSNSSQANKNSTKEYTVVFRTENGKIISRQKVKKNGSAKEPTLPKKKGYYFYSWSRSINRITGDLEITPVYLKEGSTPRIKLSKATTKSNGKNIEIKVNVTNNPGIASLSLDVLYDKKNMRLTDFKYNNSALKGATTVPFNADVKTPCLSMVNGTQNITGDFEFATLYFELISGKKGAYPIIATCDENNVYNIDETNVKFEIVNGLITVK